MLFFANNALANENLQFEKAISNKHLSIISSLNTKDLAPDKYAIATIDLNEDFIDEYILRPNQCPPQQLCPHLIIALNNRIPHVIGEFDAHKILVSYKKSYGVRHLIVYNQSSNDFITRTARWQPYISKYAY